MDTIVEIKNLKTYFKTPRGMLHAVDDVSFTIERGKTVGIVGESGCGKTTLGRTIVHLEKSTDGQILFEGKDITSVNKNELRMLRQKMQIIFQDPYSSLDPRRTVSETIMEPLILSKMYDKNQITEMTKELMKTVGLAERLWFAYPHELDGGRRQRVGIARALALSPSFVVCDEPVSALDVSIQAQILNLMQELQEEKGLTYAFITHDLSVVRHISDEICVMYLGQVVEKSPAKELFRTPLHPYTKALIAAIPIPDVHHKRNEEQILTGEVTSPIEPKPGCRFAARCRFASPECMQPQTLRKISSDHYVMCHKAETLS